jgi:hypothetical protein
MKFAVPCVPLLALRCAQLHCPACPGRHSQALLLSHRPAASRALPLAFRCAQPRPPSSSLLRRRLGLLGSQRASCCAPARSLVLVQQQQHASLSIAQRGVHRWPPRCQRLKARACRCCSQTRAGTARRFGSMADATRRPAGGGPRASLGCAQTRSPSRGRPPPPRPQMLADALAAGPTGRCPAAPAARRAGGRIVPGALPLHQNQAA